MRSLQLGYHFIIFFVVCFFFRCLENRPPIEFQWPGFFSADIPGFIFPEGPLTRSLYHRVGRVGTLPFGLREFTSDIFWGIDMIQSLIYNMITSQQNRHNWKVSAIFFVVFVEAHHCWRIHLSLRQLWSKLSVWKPKRLGVGVWVRISFCDHTSWEAYQSWSKLWMMKS